MVMFTYANKRARLVRMRVMPKRKKRAESSREIVTVARVAVPDGEEFHLYRRDGKELSFIIARAIAEKYGKDSKQYSLAIWRGLTKVGVTWSQIKVSFGRPA